ncbi:hypothetical protein RRG08_049693 [Elysia crispata]|uniref:Uncharacterized protein n=1 Tax=Elysia crispata TaxID=231223 RepID=A0AAE1DNS4_9GAST|nr:hypothetical protein RRG08_049693 [Elysia crispata]
MSKTAYKFQTECCFLDQDMGRTFVTFWVKGLRSAQPRLSKQKGGDKQSLDDVRLLNNRTKMIQCLSCSDLVKVCQCAAQDMSPVSVTIVSTIGTIDYIALHLRPSGLEHLYPVVNFHLEKILTLSPTLHVTYRTSRFACYTLHATHHLDVALNGDATMSFQYHNESELCRDIQNLSQSGTREVGIASPIEMYEAVIIILVTGFFAVILAYLFSFIRKHVYRDEVSDKERVKQGNRYGKNRG